MDLFELFATITLDTSGYDKGLQNVKKSSAEYRSDVMKLAQTYKKQGMDMSEAMKRAYAEIDKSQYETSENSKSDAKKFAQNWENAGKNISDVADKIKRGLATAAKVGTAAITAAAAGIAALTKASIENYAEYEQLVGGAELMFGDAYDFIADKAKNAYSTVQMSQNEYLQQVNGFATGLKTALGGNEQAAAELADRIINAEADIVAATGNTAENVQNAFNGIMKSNYTMLDNLQLGITPTKEGFQEVIDKVNEWNAANGKATNYMIDNLADAQNALVDYIEMQGLTGYAANEASKTISGSLASAKAAWENLVTGIANKDADLDGLIDNLVEKVTVAAGNVMPVAEKALDGVSQLIEGVLPIVADALPNVISEVLPDLMNAAISFVSALGTGVSENLESLMNSAFEVINSLVNFIIENAPALLDAAVTIMSTLVTGIAEQLPTLIPAAVQLILDLTASLIDNVDQLVDAAVAIINGLTEGVINALPILLEQMPVIIGKITAAFIKSFPDLVITVIEAVNNLRFAVVDMFPEFVDSIGATMGEIGMAIQDGADDWNSKFEDFGGRLYDWTENFNKKMKEVWDKIIDNVTEFLTPALDLGRQLMEKLIDGFVNGVSNIKEKVKEGASKFVDGIKDFFGGVFEGGFNFGVSVDGSHAGGLNYVPFDGYLAELHRGERVLTATEANQYSKGGGQSTVINQYNTFGGTNSLADQEKANRRLAAALAR